VILVSVTAMLGSKVLLVNGISAQAPFMMRRALIPINHAPDMASVWICIDFRGKSYTITTGYGIVISRMGVCAIKVTLVAIVPSGCVIMEWIHCILTTCRQ
jgi:hypothetical protein